MEISPLNNLHRIDFLLDSGKITTVNNKLNSRYQKEVHAIFIIKQLRTYISKSVQNL